MSGPAPSNPDYDSAPDGRDGAHGAIAGRMFRLALKELRETLRDRRTVATLIIMPLIVYPLLSITFQKFLLTSVSPPANTGFRIAVESEAAAKPFIDFLKRGDALLSRDQDVHEASGASHAGESPATTDGTSNSTSSAGATKPDGESHAAEHRYIETVIAADIERAVASLEVDLGLRIKNRQSLDTKTESLPGIDCELFYMERSLKGQAALDFVQARLRAVNEDYARTRLKELGATPEFPAEFAARSISGKGSPAAYSLAALIPLILILMTITGAVYPAIDLTAGERERGTLEMLVAAPVPRMGLLLAKYVAVLVVALLTATVNLVSMAVTVLVIGLGPVLFGDAGLSWLVVAQVFGLMVLFAAFFSALLLAVTSFARSFKEAQAYLIPLMLVSIAPGLVSMLPGVKLSGLLVVTPLLNIVLLARDLFEHTAEPLTALVVVASTLLFALAAITAAGRIFGTDAILYGSPGTWSDLLRWPRAPRAAPSLTSAMLLLALMFPAYFVMGNLLARLQESRLEVRLASMSAVTFVLFSGVPLVAAVAANVRLREAFRLKMASPWAFAAAVALGLSLWPMAYELVLFASQWGVGTLGEEHAERIRSLVAQFRSVPPAWIVLTLAIVPAVCEEFFFRGYLLGALVTRTSRVKAIVLSGIVFGMFHLMVTDQLAVERLLPSTLLGIVLAWVCLQSGSVFPGMLLHALHNAFLLLVSYYAEDLARAGWGDLERSHLPWGILAGSAAAIVAGIALLAFATRARSNGQAIAD